MLGHRLDGHALRDHCLGHQATNLPGSSLTEPGSGTAPDAGEAHTAQLRAQGMQMVSTEATSDYVRCDGA